MATLITILQLLVVWLLAWLMGVGVTKALVPEDLERRFGTLIAPTVGYLMFCFIAFTLSATFGLTASAASWLVMALLIGASAASQLRPAWRIDPRRLASDARLSLVLLAPMALIALIPLFVYGAQTYLGAVNPDYFAGLMDDYFLLKGHSVSTFAPPSKDSFFPIDYNAGHLSASARFGAGLFGILVKLLLGVEIRTALTLVIAFFMLSLPLTVYFFSATVLGFEEKVAKWSAWITGISAPTAMSALYFYLGQNSGLPALPLTVAACYLMLMRPGWRTLAFCAMLSNAIFINYFAMLPYALAPGGALGLYLLFTGRMKIARAAWIILGFVAITVLPQFGHLHDTADAMKAWMNVIGQSLQGQYFLDFLTESFFPYFLGVYNYPSNPWIVRALGYAESRITGFVVAMVILAVLLWAVWRWAKDRADVATRIFMVSGLVIYAAVWARYSFFQQYGYAVFKMSSWLQFVVAPFMAYALYVFREPPPGSPRPLGERASRATGRAVAMAYVVLNVAMTLQYAYNGSGRNLDTGYIVNHFGVPGNHDYFELPSAAARFVKPGESVGLIFTDSIRNFWTSYYMRSARVSILSHETLPGDDENLPDIETNQVVDYYGNVRPAKNEFFHDGTSDQLYLTWNVGDLNQDIVPRGIAGKPVWENNSFQLFRGSDVRDILFTGRGFYRLEYFKPIKEYFFPRVIRWSADGGEFYLLRPAHPDQPYRLRFDILVGYELPKDSRTLEIWHDGRKIQEIVVTSSARVVTAPFVPGKEISKIVVRIQERNRPLPRPLGLWNKSVPADYRRMNAAFANVEIVPPGGPALAPAPRLGRRLEFMDLHPIAERFDGLQLDGWIGDTASFTIPAAAGATKMVVEGMVPGNLGLAFPHRFTAAVNGREVGGIVEKPGPFTVEIPVAAGAPTADVVLTSRESKEIHEEYIRHKVLRRSMRLDAVTFR